MRTDRDGGPAILASALRKSFGAVDVLRGLDLRVERGTLTALVGPNGAGKTTAVRILSTLVPYDAGVAKVNGYDVYSEPGKVRRSIGLTGQNVAVDGLLTGRENLLMMARLFRLEKHAARERTELLVEQFDLAHAADRPVKTYSGGMRRRLDLAISLIAAPPVMFLDEPTTGLDPRSRSDLWSTIRELVDGGTTVLLTTQYLEEADRLADRVAVIDAGRIIAEGPTEELKQRVGQDRLELVFDDAEVCRAAAALLDEEGTYADADRHGVSVPVTGAKHVKQLLDQLEHAGLAVRNLSVSRPTLDDVFFTLTGRPARSLVTAGAPHGDD